MSASFRVSLLFALLSLWDQATSAHPEELAHINTSTFQKKWSVSMLILNGLIMKIHINHLGPPTILISLLNLTDKSL